MAGIRNRPSDGLGPPYGQAAADTLTSTYGWPSRVRVEGHVAVGNADHREVGVERRIVQLGDGGRPPGVVGEVHDRQAVEVGHDEPVAVEHHPLASADGRAVDPRDRSTTGSPRVEVDAV